MNLLNSQGFEVALRKAYERNLSAIPSTIQYEYHEFDLNRKCGQQPCITMASVANVIDSSVGRQHVFMVRFEPPVQRRKPSRATVLDRQTGVCRTSCLDCLDRTNMMQFAIAQKSLVMMLQRLGKMPVVTLDESPQTPSPDFHGNLLTEVLERASMAAYRQLWIDNGNAIAMQCTCFIN
jgi:hypothetical protein